MNLSLLRSLAYVSIPNSVVLGDPREYDVIFTEAVTGVFLIHERVSTALVLTDDDRRMATWSRDEQSIHRGYVDAYLRALCGVEDTAEIQIDMVTPTETL